MNAALKLPGTSNAWTMPIKARIDMLTTGASRLGSSVTDTHMSCPEAGRQRVPLMDEPFGTLDAISCSELQALCASTCRETGVTTLLVTHDLFEADFLADQSDKSAR
jgi:ABC-type cobalamin transport system ATPase subunit